MPKRSELGEYVEIPALEEKEWTDFRIGHLFSIERPDPRSKDGYAGGDIPFVASGSTNNGVAKWCEPGPGEKTDKAGCITVSPVDGSAFYQPVDFLGRGGAGSSILMLRSASIGAYSGPFIAKMIAQTCSVKYSYGRMGSKTGIEHEHIMLPTDKEGEPDYAYMAQYTKNAMIRQYDRYLTLLKREMRKYEKEEEESRTDGPLVPLSRKDWKPVLLSDLGKIESGKDIYAAERIPGRLPYITSGSRNNGIGYFVGNSNGTLDKGYVAFNRNGTVGKAFYHDYPSLMGNDCRKLHIRKADRNKYVGLFIAGAISKQSECFSYSRKLGTERAKNLQVMLPVDGKGEPDYEYMERYVRRMLMRGCARMLARLE